MSHRNRNRFKKPKGSPFDQNGPNHAALRRSLEWLETHGPDAPVSVELPSESEKIPTESKEIRSEPSEQSAPKESAPEESAPSQTEPPPETEPAQIEATGAETPAAPTTESQTPEPEIEPTAPEEDLTGEPPTTEDDLEAAAVHAAQRSHRNPIVRARRVRRRSNANATNPDRHRRLCAICHHEDVEAIEDAFLQWQRPGDIKYEFKLPSRLCIYRHARAFGLFEERARNIRFTLENVLEESSRCRVTGDTVIRAVRAYSCLDRDGHWIEPPRHLIVSRQPYPDRAKSLDDGKELTVEPTKVIEKGA